MPMCCVKNCKSTSRTLGISFHRFPKEKEIEWKRVIGRPHLTDSQNDRICSLHFEDNDYLLNYKNRKCLKPDAIPSLFPQVYLKTELEFTAEPILDGSRVKEENLVEDPLELKVESLHSIKEENLEESPLELKVESLSSSSSTSTGSSDVQTRANETFIKLHIKSLKLDHSYSRSSSMQEQTVIVKKQTLLRLKNKLNASRQKVKRLQKQVFRLKNLVFNLKKAARFNTNVNKSQLRMQK
ncbi:uncharacterized protein LOC123007992 [Tribolium madens]|uniref:uncharacterized protein LOC123007992 n=1 Tax=Tribolium madens TaxID=41895 RepID=UPI001CF741DB|nr:uncharacterized protein LOC123007992 [Tribolium madens]